MNVYWLEQNEADVPFENNWLSAGELARLKNMRFEKRRADFRLGRWTAKRALAACLNLSAHFPALAEIEIRPEPSGAPTAFIGNKATEVTISLSHRSGKAICAITTDGAVALGCDLELIEPRSDEFLSDYFTQQEQKLVASLENGERSRILALMWSAKESALKALREGLRLDTRELTVIPGEPARAGTDLWHPLCVHLRTEQVFQGWWRHANDVLRTMVATPAPEQPIYLNIAK